MSWRDDTPAEIQDDLDRLTDEALQAAQHLLDESGEFYPFAVCLDDDGSSRIVAAYDGDEHPPSRDVLELLYRGIAQERDGIRAAAVVAMVVVEGGDAVQAEVEHRDGGPAIAVFLPFSRKRLRRGLEYGDLAAAPGERHVWT
jgi:hypothetical protein